jgi:predicted DCC family thiol-disulfide oxidoreductase YuxK
VKSAVQVASPPTKPLLVYDGDCRFCLLWIRRWHQATGDRIEYLPYQDPRIATQFPEIPRPQFESAVQLIQPDGTVYGGAEAVFRSRAYGPHAQWLVDCYQHWPAFAGLTEWAYHFVARHRTFFSWMTRMLWGGTVEPPTQFLVRRLFLRLLGVIYLIAFVSLSVQIVGLIGHNGIVPAEGTMEMARAQLAETSPAERYHLLPTLCWWGTSDGFLKFQCVLGAALAVLVIIGVAPAPCLFLLWLIYLSLGSVCDVFLGFQWDVLLLETGFLGIFFAPWQWLPRRIEREAPPSRIVLWLLRWLLFRLMFESGAVKLLEDDPSNPTWHRLTALNYHYETQPLPTWIGWYAHHLPAWFHKCEVVAVFAVELVVPFLIFLPRRPRQFGCVLLLAFQLIIVLTGNYCFFNLLTIALCLTLLDDAALQTCKRSCRNLIQRLARILRRQKHREAQAPDTPHLLAAPKRSEGGTPDTPHLTPPRGRLRWPWPVTVILAVIVLCTSCVQLTGMFSTRQPGVRYQLPRSVLEVYRWLLPLRSFNSYGLFRVMTTTRPEIIIEGSNDGVSWEPYEFKYKPGDLKRRPGFVAPHQPRLDWQMWFAALQDYRSNPWLINCCVRLLQGSPEVLALLQRNPFPDAPPRLVRAVLYEYHFTDLETRRKTGQWWRRELKGIYLPPLALRREQAEPIP